MGSSRAATRAICRSCLPNQDGSLPHVVQRIDDYLDDFFDQRVFVAACERGAPVDILEFYLERTTPNWMEAVNAAARSGHLNVLQWILTKYNDDLGPWDADFDEATDLACRFGHLEVAEWLRRYWPQDHDSPIDFASINGHFDIVKRFHCVAHGASCRYAYTNAAGGGHFEIVKWLHKNCISDLIGYEAKRITPVIDYAAQKGGVEWAAANGHLEMVKWLHRYFSDKFTAGAMDSAGGAGQLEIVKWLHQNRTEGCTKWAMDYAAGDGHLEMLHENRTEGFSTNTIEFATSKGNLPVLRWLYECQPAAFSRRGTLMEFAVRNGHLNVVRWLHEQHFDECFADIVISAAWRGFLDVVRCVFDSNINQDCGAELRRAVDDGHIEVIKLLITSEGPASYAVYSGKGIDFYVVNLLNGADQCRWKASSQHEQTTREMVELLAWFYEKNHDGCFSRLVELMLERGYQRLVHQFFVSQDNVDFLKHIKLAIQYRRTSLTRWLIRNYPDLDVDTALSLVKPQSG